MTKAAGARDVGIVPRVEGGDQGVLRLLVVIVPPDAGGQLGEIVHRVCNGCELAAL